MCGLAINIPSFVHLLKKVDFDAIVDHLVIMHIMRSKVEPATTRIKRLLELLSSYSFKLYCIKDKDMVLSDFLSRQKTDDSNPHEIIPISFSLRKVLHESYYKIGDITRTVDLEMDKYMVQTRAQTKSSGVDVPEVHGANKGLIPHVKPKKSLIFQVHAQSILHATWGLYITHHLQTKDHLQIQCPYPKPRVGQGRAGIRRKAKVTLPISKPIQIPTPPIIKPAPRTAQPLTEPLTQSQDSTIPQHHVPTMPQPIVEPTPASITQPVEPITWNRLIPPYQEPFKRLLTKTPWCDTHEWQFERFLGLWHRQEYQIWRIFTPSGGYNFQNLWMTWQILHPRAHQIERFNRYHKINSEILTKTSGYWQDHRCDKKKSWEAHTCHLPLRKSKLDILLVLILKIYTFIWPRTNCLVRRVLYTRWKI